MSGPCGITQLVLPLPSHFVPPILIQFLLPNPHLLRRHLQQLIIPNVGDGFFNWHYSWWDEVDLLVVGVGPYVGYFLLLCCVYLHVLFFVVLAYYEAVVDLHAWLDEERPELLHLFEDVGGGHSLAHADYCPLAVAS